MKTWETLYKRTRTGAIQQWMISTSDYPTGSMIVKISGQLGGKLTEHRESVNEGKQKRNVIEQAEFQAESDYKKKHDEGYKSLKNLGFKNGEFGNDNVDRVRLEKFLPIFNTDASGNVKPMLAKPVDWDKVTYPCLIQPKLDGVRCLMVATNNSDGSSSIVFLTRSGKEYTTLDHIRTDVDSYMYSWLPNKFILDGEIYSDELTFQEIVAAVKKLRPDSLKLKFRVYDLVNDMKQQERWDETVRIVDSIGSPFVWPVSSLMSYNKQDIVDSHNKWVSEGNEGAMIRLLDGTYDQGQRSSSLLKVKEFNTNEFTFIRFETGQREEDLIAVCCKQDGVCFKAKVVGTKAEKEKLKTIPETKLEYKQYTIKHFGYTDDGLPRFPIGIGFRDYE